MYHQAELLEDESSKAQLLVDSYEVCVFYLFIYYVIFDLLCHIFTYIPHQ